MTIESSSGKNSSVESRHPLDLLHTLANNLEAKSKGLQLFHCRNGGRVQAQEITSESNPYDYCTSIMGLSSKITTLLLLVTSDNNTLLNHQDPLKDLSLRFREECSFCPDIFQFQWSTSGEHCMGVDSENRVRNNSNNNQEQHKHTGQNETNRY